MDTILIVIISVMIVIGVLIWLIVIAQQRKYKRNTIQLFGSNYIVDEVNSTNKSFDMKVSKLDKVVEYIGVSYIIHYSYDILDEINRLLDKNAVLNAYINKPIDDTFGIIVPNLDYELDIPNVESKFHHDPKMNAFLNWIMYNIIDNKLDVFNTSINNELVDMYINSISSIQIPTNDVYQSMLDDNIEGKDTTPVDSVEIFKTTYSNAITNPIIRNRMNALLKYCWMKSDQSNYSVCKYIAKHRKQTIEDNALLCGCLIAAYNASYSPGADSKLHAVVDAFKFDDKKTILNAFSAYLNISAACGNDDTNTAAAAYGSDVFENMKQHLEQVLVNKYTDVRDNECIKAIDKYDTASIDKGHMFHRIKMVGQQMHCRYHKSNKPSPNAFQIDDFNVFEYPYDYAATINSGAKTLNNAFTRMTTTSIIKASHVCTDMLNHSRDWSTPFDTLRKNEFNGVNSVAIIYNKHGDYFLEKLGSGSTDKDIVIADVIPASVMAASCAERLLKQIETYFDEDALRAISTWINNNVTFEICGLGVYAKFSNPAITKDTAYDSCVNDIPGLGDFINNVVANDKVLDYIICQHHILNRLHMIANNGFIDKRAGSDMHYMTSVHDV